MSESERMEYFNQDCLKLVLHDDHGVKYTFAIPGRVPEAKIHHIAWIVDITHPQNESIKVKDHD
jgi:hypothetical protein